MKSQSAVRNGSLWAHPDVNAFEKNTNIDSVLAFVMMVLMFRYLNIFSIATPKSYRPLTKTGRAHDPNVLESRTRQDDRFFQENKNPPQVQSI